MANRWENNGNTDLLFPKTSELCFKEPVWPESVGILADTGDWQWGLEILSIGED